MLWNLIFGLLFLGANRYGDYITDECPQGGYACPKICDVDHKHQPIKECYGKIIKEDKSRTNKNPIYKGEQCPEDTVAEN